MEVLRCIPESAEGIEKKKLEATLGADVVKVLGGFFDLNWLFSSDRSLSTSLHELGSLEVVDDGASARQECTGRAGENRAICSRHPTPCLEHNSTCLLTVVIVITAH